jgi:glycosyltransferase involved in cell wall biosynthesis
MKCRKNGTAVDVKAVDIRVVGPYVRMMQKRPTITIVLCTFNGAAYLNAQLDSLLKQTFTDWRLLVSDDGSTDQTCEMIRKFATQNPDRDIKLIDGPAQGFASNFLSALRHEMCCECMVAFCDQDDVWLPEKLERAVSHLQNDIPRAYGSVVQMVDADLNVLSQTPAPKYPVNFENLLVENCTVGNTVVLNARAVDAVRSQPLDIAHPFHDWWALLLTAGVGGAIVVDPRPSVLYRQHGKNIIGAATGIARKRRNLMALMGPYQLRLRKNIDALSQIEHELTSENRAALRLFKQAAASGWKIIPILKMLRRGIRRQRLVDTLFMCLALLKV